MPALVMSKPDVLKPLPGAASSASTQPAAARGAGGFALPPSPPWIEGGAGVPASGTANGQGAPTLDMRELPSFTAPERQLPRVAP
jgi:hypothetical protein